MPGGCWLLAWAQVYLQLPVSTLCIPGLPGTRGEVQICTGAVLGEV